MAAKKLTMDMTAGRPLPLLLRFAVPLILSALFQQLYSFVDTAIVGRCISVQALSAVGVTNSVSFFILRLVMGSAIGFNIPLAQRFGAGDREELSRYFWNGLYLIVLLGAAVTAVMLPLLRPLRNGSVKNRRPPMCRLPSADDSRYFIRGPTWPGAGFRR